MMDASGIIEKLSSAQEKISSSGIMPISVRSKKLRDFAKLLYRSRKALYAAVAEDLGRDDATTIMCEFQPLLSIIYYLADNLRSLAGARWVMDNMATFPSFSRVKPEPFGHVLVISTWNYPLLLSLEPALGAFAAGNRVVLKLSPRSGHTMSLIRKLVEEFFSSDEILVVGNELTMDELLRYRYDYIFLTGSSSTGKLVMRAAAENLTPVTLELGGKNPCIVCENANLKVAAKRIVWGKFLNAGQSCAAPDHLFVHRRVKAELLHHIAAYIKKFYGEHPLDNGRYCRLPDQQAYDRVCRIISGGRLVCGGDRDPQRLAIEPTVIDQINPEDPAFAGEIFAPVLPVYEFSGDNEVLMRIRRHGKPLALYCFGGRKSFRDLLQRATSSGALVFDDTLIHFANANIPFGGVGSSGMGAYHGKLTFKTFSHYKPVVSKFTFPDWSLRYPPYSRLFTALLDFFARFRI